MNLIGKYKSVRTHASFVIFSMTISTAAPQKTRVLPSWQTVLSDIQLAVPLFGNDGPQWRLDYIDPPDNTVHAAPNENLPPHNLTARVPGDLISDLMRHGVVDDPYFDMNLWEQQDQWLGPQMKDAVNANSSSTKNDSTSPCQKQQTRIWTYSAEVELPSSDISSTSWQLVVESLQMGATVYWDGVVLGNVTDQFLRYSFWIPHSNQQAGNHTLSVTFDPLIDTNGRFMACSGGWDWAPYTLACDRQGRRTFSMGIVAPVYLVAVDQVAISYLVPKIYYDGEDLPRKPMDIIHPDADFTVKLDVQLDFPPTPRNSSSNHSYYLLATSDFASDAKMHKIARVSGNNSNQVVTFTMKAFKDTIELWWPNGMGPHPLYNVQVTIMSSNQAQAYKQQQSPMLQTTKRRRLSESPDGTNRVQWFNKQVGFRTTAIVTTNETDTVNEYEEGTGLHGMYFRVNGALVMARGANVIPADQLEGRYRYGENSVSNRGYKFTIQSAADANMNMVRVWGGGKILPSSFYRACDELGVMVYHDQMFAQRGHAPSETDTIESEIRHVVLSLASHPSIVVWNGCNECEVIMGTATEIYATFVMRIVAATDNTRSVWPTSPSRYGWRTGVDEYDSKPNGNPLATRDPEDHKGETGIESHGPYMRAYSEIYPGVNGVNQHFSYDLSPAKFYQGEIGPQYPNKFASEFGASVWSSFESMSGTLRPEHWGIHGGEIPDRCWNLVGMENVCSGPNALAQRNYPCDTYIQKAFGDVIGLDAVGEMAFQAHLYQCLIAQTLWLKNTIEARRSENSFGLLIWQLNENWPTGGWGLVEYSGDPKSQTLPGQIIGGRWKPMMHLMRKSLFRDVVAACGSDKQCFIRNDGMVPVSVVVTLEAWVIGSTDGEEFEKSFDLQGGISNTARFEMPADWDEGKIDAIILSVHDAKENSIAWMEESVYLSTEPLHMANLRSIPVHIAHAIDSIAGNATAATVSISSDVLALYVVLTTKASGRFSDNAFVLRPGQRKTVTFTTVEAGDVLDLELLSGSLRVEHLGYYYQA